MLQGAIKKNPHFCLWFGELEQTCVHSIRVSSSRTIRVPTPFKVVHLGGSGGSGRKAKWGSKREMKRESEEREGEDRGGYRREGERERETKKRGREREIMACMWRWKGWGRSYSYRAPRQFGLWCRDVARLERPRESNPESRRTGSWLGDVESTLRLEGTGWGKRRGRRWTGRGHRASIEVTGNREEARPLPARLAFEVSQQKVGVNVIRKYPVGGMISLWHGSFFDWFKMQIFYISFMWKLSENLA